MRTLVLVLTVSALPAAALAQDRRTSTEVRVETFTDADTVTGTLEGPEVESILIDRRRRRHTLIRPRTDFHPELYQSVHDL